MQRGILIIAATLAAFLSIGGVSDDTEIHGRVVKVADGDTLTILAAAGRAGSMNPPSPVVSGWASSINSSSAGRASSMNPPPPVATQHKIRLYGIDAPESHQAFGQKSKQHLSSLVFGKDVRVKYKSRDKYGRILGTIYVDGLDINLEMLRAGLAWHYKRFDSTPAYAAAELEARQNRRGLWVDSNPAPPEDFRHGVKSAAQTAASSNLPRRLVRRGLGEGGTTAFSRVECRAGNALPVSSRTAAPVNSTWPDTGYWLSTNSNKRHNRRCENYRKTRGYPCGKDEGTPCGKCGG